jgi:hypothetical protein
MNLLQASRQWAERPADERFFNLKDLRDACEHYYSTAKETSANPDQIRVREATSDEFKKHGDDLRFVVESEDTPARNARFSHWSFGQFCRLLEAPADYLRGLPTDLACRNLEHGIEKWQKRKDRVPVKLLTHRNGDNLLRAITSTGYSRIWNWEVAERLMELGTDWIIPPARPAFQNQPGSRIATKDDILPNQGDFGLSVNVGDMIAPAGLYASDHDMFVFMVNEKSRINDGSGLGLAKGMFISNSEVGAQSLKITKFRYRHCCGNHICWDCSGVLEVRIVHKGEADSRFIKELSIELARYGEEGVAEEEQMIQAAQQYQLGKDKDEVLDSLFGIRNLNVPLKQLGLAYDIAEQHVDTDGSPRTAWGMVQGMTRLSQQIDWMDQRTKLDRAAGRILDLATK